MMKSKEIKDSYPLGGMIVITALGIMGCLFMYLSGLTEVRSFDDLYQCFYKSGMEIIAGAFFVFIALFVWIGYFINLINGVKTEVLYLYKDYTGESYFINKKGKALLCQVSVPDEANKFYYVKKTYNIVIEVLNECTDSSITKNLPTKEKKGYWNYCYLPGVGSFERLFVLPIAYVMAIPGILSIIMADGFDKIYGVLFSFIPVFILIYDLVYKIKLNKALETGNLPEQLSVDEDGNPVGFEIVDTKRMEKAADGVLKAVYIVPMIGIIIFLIWLIFHMEYTPISLIGLPLFIAGIIGLLCNIASVLDWFDIGNILYKMYVAVFLSYWFGFIGFFIYSDIKEKLGLQMLIFTVPFIAAGIYLFYKTFIKKNK